MSALSDSVRLQRLLRLPLLRAIHTITIRANEAKTQELMRERTMSRVKQLRIHEAAVGKRRHANP